MPQDEAAIMKLREQLEWRGPLGKVMKNIVLERALAEALLARIDDPDRIPFQP